MPDVAQPVPPGNCGRPRTPRHRPGRSPRKFHRPPATQFAARTKRWTEPRMRPRLAILNRPKLRRPRHSRPWLRRNPRWARRRLELPGWRLTLAKRARNRVRARKPARRRQPVSPQRAGRERERRRRVGTTRSGKVAAAAPAGRGAAEFLGLPERDRQAIQQSQSEKYPQEYGSMIEEYMRSLASDSGGK